MARTFQAKDALEYKMKWKDPHRELEAAEREIKTVNDALDALVEARILPHSDYDFEKMLAHRRAVAENFEIPWTAITPRMQRFLFALNAIAQPGTVVAVGIFCGNTFISNAGAAAGPGRCYDAQRLVGIEIDEKEADRARRNVSKIDPEGRCEIIAADGIPWLHDFDGTIDLLYLDADGPPGKGKGIYLDLLEAGLHALRPGSLVLAHNSHNSAESLKEYLAFVREPSNFRESVNVVIDDQGLEVSQG